MVADAQPVIGGEHVIRADEASGVSDVSEILHSQKGAEEIVVMGVEVCGVGLGVVPAEVYGHVPKVEPLRDIRDIPLDFGFLVRLLRVDHAVDPDAPGVAEPRFERGHPQ